MSFVFGAIVGFAVFPFLWHCGKALYGALTKTTKNW